MMLSHMYNSGSRRGGV